MLLPVGMLAGLGVCACGGTPVSPVQPTVVDTTLTGAWNGPASDSSGPGHLTWLVTQDGDAFSGTLAMVDGVTGIEAVGTVSGTVTGTRVSFSMRLPSGAFTRPLQLCATSVDGEGTRAGATLTGSYSGTNTCTGRIDAGRITMSRQ